MPTATTAYYRKIFGFDLWAMERALDNLAHLDPPPAQPRGRLSHVVAAQRVWLARLEPERFEAPTDFFPVWELEDIRAEAKKTNAEVRAFIEGLSDEDLDREVRYTSSEGTEHSNRIFEVLTQLATHGGYHRGQVASDIGPALRDKGIKPKATDWIFYTRR